MSPKQKMDFAFHNKKNKNVVDIVDIIFIGEKGIGL